MKGSVTAPDLLMLIILSLGLITPFVMAASYMDDMGKMGTIIGEVTDILEKPELIRPDRIVEKPQGIDILTEELPLLRAKLGISQENLCEIVGISRQTYSGIETKKKKMSWNIFLSMLML